MYAPNKVSTREDEEKPRMRERTRQRIPDPAYAVELRNDGNFETL